MTRPTDADCARRAGVALGLAVIFALIFYTVNTPLGPVIGSDNAMYLTMGTALARGYAPYTQIFDHKGPLLFLLQMLPQMLGGGYSTLAVFMQQVLVLWGCLLVLGALARALNAPPLAVQVVYLALCCSLVEGGNLTEEYASLPTLLGLWLALRAFGGGDERAARALLAPAVGMGACAAACFLLRANNALALLGVSLGLAVALAWQRRFAALGWCALGISLGAVAVTLPIALWLVAQGALREAVYASITHNFMYAQTGGGSRLYMLFATGYGLAAWVMAALSCAGAAVLVRRGRRALALGLAMGAAAAAMGAFISHKFYDHYLVLGAPVAAFGAAILLGALRGRWRRVGLSAVALVGGIWLAVCGVRTQNMRAAEYASWPQFEKDAQALYAQVPEDERDAFMAYRVEPRWYVATGALPCMRFYFLQEILAQADPAVMEEIVDTFTREPPRWLVIFYNRPFEPPYDPRVADIFARAYTVIDTAGEYQLLRYRDGN